MIGKTLSHYKVLEKIGQGGMGEVYRAEDTNLSREVAIKVLPEQFTKDPQRLARFEREAKLLASLNHPNIAAIYGFEEADDVRFLAMELVPGETLQERVAKGPLPVEEALEVCRQIAEGVEAAHEKGVIHRDLKPANVKVTPEGKVKILDFGLAKAFEEETPVTDISQSPTLTEEMTRAGVILGTAAYMSPEQAKGEAVDKRADIFAFGCVLYELLTAKRTFDGKTITETLGAIIHKEPDWNALPNTTPWRIRDLLRRCLQKAVHDRLDGIANVRIEIKMAVEEPTTVSPTGAASAVQPGQQRWGMTVGLVVLAVVVTGLVFWLLIQPSSPEQRLNKFVITPSATAPLRSTGSNELAISPDGRHFIYTATGAGGNQLYLRSLDDFVDRPIPGTEGVIGSPFFSPDGESVGFFTPGSLKKVSLAGGSPITLCAAINPAQGGSWSPEGTIVFTAGGEAVPFLYRVSAAGGEREILATSDPDKGESGYNTPHLLPDGKGVLASLFLPPGDYRIDVVSLDTGERKIILEHAKDAMYVETGHLIYEQAGTGNLMAVLFDLTSLEVTGDPVPVVQGVRGNLPGYVDYAVSDNGTLVYVPGTSTGGVDRALVWVDREGAVEPLGAPPGSYRDPRLSPDGRRLAVRNGVENPDIWVYDMGRQTLSRLTFAPEADETPVWTPDGKWVTFAGDRDGVRNLLRRVADGSEEEEQLVTLQGHAHANSWSPDGQVLVFGMGQQSASEGIWLLPLEEDRKPTLFLKTPGNVFASRLSPDGHWIAYASDESGRPEIYVQPFPGLGGKWQISTDGGGHAVWARNGRELFYRNGDKLMVVEVTTEPTFAPGSPKALFEGQFYTSGDGNTNYDVAPDGQRFVMIKDSAEQQESGQINVVLNWFEELKRLVPTN